MSGKVLIISGVAGAGKSTIGKLLAQRLGWDFIEGDNFHSSENIQKMARGEPLSEEDRIPWLMKVQAEIKRCLTEHVPAILACSALKENYRNILRIDAQRVHFIFLTGEFVLLKERLQQRKKHFMSPSLLADQLELLELTNGAHTIDISKPKKFVVESIESWVRTHWLQN